MEGGRDRIWRFINACRTHTRSAQASSPAGVGVRIIHTSGGVSATTRGELRACGDVVIERQ